MSDLKSTFDAAGEAVILNDFRAYAKMIFIFSALAAHVTEADGSYSHRHPFGASPTQPAGASRPRRRRPGSKRW